MQISVALTTADPVERATLAWRFAAIAVTTMLAQIVSSVLFQRLCQRAHAELRRFISARVIGADFRRLEQIGGPRVQSALSEHSVTVADFFVNFPVMMINAVIVTGCLIYLAWLSWQVFLAAAAVVGLGSLGYHFGHLRAIRHLNVAAKAQDRLFDHFRALTDGAKELRLNAGKRARFAEDVLGDAIEAVRRERTRGMSIFMVSTAWGGFLIYAFIGLVLFVLVGDAPDSARIMTGFALVFVYMVAPLENLLLALPRANFARASAARIDEIISELQRREGDAQLRSARFESLSLTGVRHRYYHEAANEIFTLGPIDLDFAPGRIDFVVGGNGSGKTTFAKLLVGLYPPEDGTVRFNGEAVDDTSRDSYRQRFSAIFSDFHLFDRLLDATSSSDLDAKGNALLAKLHLQHKAQVREGAFTTRALSHGQRKRLALVVAYLEDREILVFDEWAADQDPVFKDVFYRELLPELKSMGKAILVISHDDRYFHLADRLIRMENGRVTAIETQAGDTAPLDRVVA